MYAQWKWQYAVSATVTANNRSYDRTESPLVTVTGEATGGTMYYALGDNETTAPEFDGNSSNTDKKWSKSVPAATGIGTYYVWYKVIGDETHSDTEAKCVKVEIAAPASTPSGGGDSGSGGDNGSGGNSGTSYTIPVTNESTVRVDASISGGNAAVNEISTDDISTIITGDVSTIGGEEHKPAGSIVVDLSGAPVEVSSVELTKSSVENLAEAVSNGENLESIKLILTNVTIELDQKTLETMVSVAQGNSIRLVVDDIEQAKLNDKQQDALKTFVSAEPFEVYFESNGHRISDFGGGSMAITLKFTPETGRDPENYFIAYLNPDGSVTLYPSTVKNGTISTVLDHNSEYAVVYDDSRDKAHARKVTIKTVRASKGKKALVKWKKLKDINGYQIAYSTSKKFTKKTTKKITVGAKTAKKTIKKLKAGKKYYFKVRPYTTLQDPASGMNENVFGTWSNVKKIKAKK